MEIQGSLFFGLLVGGIIFAVFRAINEKAVERRIHLERTMARTEAEAEVRAIRSKIAALKAVAAAEALALESIKVAQGASQEKTSHHQVANSVERWPDWSKE